MTARLGAVNVVHALIPDVLGSEDRTAIDKRAVDVRIAVSVPGEADVGLAGDQIYDRKHHGGPDQAIYAYAAEDRSWWAAELGRDLAPGVFGERWQIGDDGVLLEVTAPRIPCRTFQGWMDEPHWVKRFTAHGAPGAYLRILSPGTIGAGDPIEVVDRPEHGVTIGDVFVIRRAPADGLLRMLEMPGLHAELADSARRDLAARAP